MNEKTEQEPVLIYKDFSSDNLKHEEDEHTVTLSETEVKLKHKPGERALVTQVDVREYRGVVANELLLRDAMSDFSVKMWPVMDPHQDYEVRIELVAK